MRSLTLAEIGASVGTAPQDRATGSLVVTRVSTDSRETRPGDLFWAIAGDRFDGHQFVDQAFAAGAVAAVVRTECVATSGPLVRVSDTREALGRFAAWYRGKCRATVIGITGSVGKTSTREAIYAVLSERWVGIRSVKNFNNDIGVPLSLLELEPDHQFAVIEMGASGPGEIARLAKIAGPQIGVLTRIGAAHLEGFGSIEGVSRAKEELVAALGRTGTAVLNADDPRLRVIGETAKCGVLWYGTHSNPWPLIARGVDIKPAGETVSFRLECGPRVNLAAAGGHQVFAALAAAAVGRWLGMADREIVAGLEKYRSAAMRCQVERIGGVTVINDAYNASPPSMWAALELLNTWPTAGRRVLLCGDMKELGSTGPAFHQRLGVQIASSMVDFCVAVGPLSAAVVASARESGMSADAIVHCEFIEPAVMTLRPWLRDGDVVLVKASRAMQLEQAVVWLRERLAA